jgi:hypothetical protein
MLTRGWRCRASLACVALLGGCTGQIGGDTGGENPPASNTSTSDLPCDVETVLTNHCWSCHGATPAEGLPALTTVAAASRGGEGREVASAHVRTTRNSVA